jgi:RecT family
MTGELELRSEAIAPEVVAWKVAQRICRTSFVPASFRGKPEETFAAILWGQEYGWNAIRSINSVDVIQGKPTLKPEAMRALIRDAGHKIRTDVYTNETVVLVGIRRDTGETETVEWTIEDATRADLDGKQNWKQYPRAMLLARATAELARLLFADVIGGTSYTAEELGADVDVSRGDDGPAVVSGEVAAVDPPACVYDDDPVEWDPDDPERPF